MAEPATFPGEQISEPVVYRRLSGFAIASFASAAFFTVSIVIAGLWALRDRNALLQLWILGPPIVCAMLALVAMYLIRNSEGTLAGMKLAVWGWWLSVITGLGYGAYFGATYFAVNQQADVFAQRWFDKLKEGKLAEAFLDCMDPAARKKVNPQDLEKINYQFMMALGAGPDAASRNPIDTLHENPIVQAVGQGGAKAVVKSQGAEEWDYRSGAYKIRRRYQIQNDEAAYEADVTMIGMESKNREYEGRQWQMVYKEMRIADTKLTDLGKKIGNVRRESGRFLEEWTARLQFGDLPGVYGLTLNADQRKGLGAKSLGLLFDGLAAGSIPGQGMPGGPLAGCLVVCNVKLSRDRYRQELNELLHRNPVLVANKQLAAEPVGKTALTILDALLGGPPTLAGQLRRATVESKNSVRRPWRIEKDRLVLAHDCKMIFEIAGRPACTMESTLTVESAPGVLDTNGRPDWRLVRMEPIAAFQSRPDGKPDHQKIAIDTTTGDIRKPGPDGSTIPFGNYPPKGKEPTK